MYKMIFVSKRAPKILYYFILKKGAIPAILSCHVEY